MCVVYWCVPMGGNTCACRYMETRVFPDCSMRQSLSLEFSSAWLAGHWALGTPVVFVPILTHRAGATHVQCCFQLLVYCPMFTQWPWEFCRVIDLEPALENGVLSGTCMSQLTSASCGVNFMGWEKLTSHELSDLPFSSRQLQRQTSH